MTRFLRILFAAVLLCAVLFWVGVADLLRVLSSVQIEYVVYLLLLSVVMIWASCLKWQLFIKASGNDVSMLHLMRLYTVGYFFNTFTPSYVGGDIARSYHLGKYLKNQGDAFLATFLERFTGLLAMSLLGVIFVVVGTEVTAGLQLAILSIGFLAFVLALACFWEPAAGLGFSLLQKLISLGGTHHLAVRLQRLVDSVQEGLAYARNNRSLLFEALCLSLMFHVLTVLNTYIAARAVAWGDPDISGLFVVVPLVLLVSMAPLTPSGIGIQEGAFVFLLERIGGTRAQGLGVGLVLRAKVMVLAVVGGLLWVQMQRKEPKSTSSRVACY